MSAAACSRWPWRPGLPGALPCHPSRARRQLVELHLSEAVAIVLAPSTSLSLLFSLRTHRRLLGGEPHPTVHPVWGVPRAIGVLALATVGVAVESEILVHDDRADDRGVGLLSRPSSA